MEMLILNFRFSFEFFYVGFLYTVNTQKRGTRCFDIHCDVHHDNGKINFIITHIYVLRVSYSAMKFYCRRKDDNLKLGKTAL